MSGREKRTERPGPARLQQNQNGFSRKALRLKIVGLAGSYGLYTLAAIIFADIVWTAVRRRREKH